MKRATYGEPTLDLFPDEADVELPIDDLEPATRASVDLGHAVTDLTNALAACLSWAEGRTTPNAERVRYWRTLVGRPAVVDDPGTPEARRDEGIARAAAKWTDEEVALVDTAIRTVARRVRARYDDVAGDRFIDDTDLLEFTTADVWAELDGRVPVTKGIAGRMTAAKTAGLIVNTGRTVIAPRESTGPNHGQRLTVWRAL